MSKSIAVWPYEWKITASRKNIVDKENWGFIMAATLHTGSSTAPAFRNLIDRLEFVRGLALSTYSQTPELDLRSALSDSTTGRMSTYFLDLDGVLSRIESATIYYQVFAVDRTAALETIKGAFESITNLLYPSYEIGKTLPPEINARVERAFVKASKAFAVLASFAKRKEYDLALLSISENPVARLDQQPNRPAHDPNKKSPGSASSDRSAAMPKDNAIAINRSIPQGVAFRESAEAVPTQNRRRCERFKLSIPARVTGYDHNNVKWNEMTETIDVSRTGVRLKLRRRVKQGMVLFATLPLPSKLRSHGFAEQSYNVYILVRRVEPPKHGVRAIGAEFLGERPPNGFLEKPWGTFRVKRWSGNERRRPQREKVSEIVKVEYLDESMQSIGREETKTEDISRGGLRLVTKAAPSEFDLVLVSCPRLKFEALAALRNRYRGKDGFERLCFQLIEKQFPLELSSSRTTS